MFCALLVAIINFFDCVYCPTDSDIYVVMVMAQRETRLSVKCTQTRHRRFVDGSIATRNCLQQIYVRLRPTSESCMICVDDAAEGAILLHHVNSHMIDTTTCLPRFLVASNKSLFLQ